MKRFFKKYRSLLLVMLIGAFCIGGTYAFLKANDTNVTNTFSVANVGTKVIEDQGGTEESKVITVQNTGSSPSYVRARVVVSAGTASVQYVTAVPSVRADNTIYVVLGSGWTKVAASDGDIYYYNSTLSAGATTTAVVSGVYCGSGVAAGSFDVIAYAEATLASTGGVSCTAAEAQSAFNAVT